MASDSTPAVPPAPGERPCPAYTRPTRRASLIAEIPHDERPRERLLRKGSQSLSDAELVAILLRNGRPGASVLEVAREVLAEAGGLTGLSTACTRSLRRRGVGEVKIATLLAAVEIACRMAGAAVPGIGFPPSRRRNMGVPGLPHFLNTGNIPRGGGTTREIGGLRGLRYIHFVVFA